MKKYLYLIFILILTASCYQPERNCKEFKTGEFSFTSIVGGKELTTTFIRNADEEVDYYSGKTDTSSVRWINDCEYIVKKLNPKNKAEEKSIHMKILSTTDNSYTFEYSIVGESKKIIGTAIKTN
jgi:hypothetical protein